MIFTRGNIRDQLLGDGIKFDPSTMYMLANDFIYEVEKISIDNDVEENDRVETPPVRRKSCETKG